MKKSSLVVGLLLALLTGCAHQPSTDSPVVEWSSPEGVSRLERSDSKVDFFALANHFEGQENKIFCAPASATIVLNALRSRPSKEPVPTDKSVLSLKETKYLPQDFSPFYPRYTQATFWTAAKKPVKPREVVLGKPTGGLNDFGFQLRQLAEALKAHDLNVELYVVDEKMDESTVREKMKANLENKGDFVIVNYARESLNQPGGGHVSPVGAYDPDSDSFLIMDVTPNKADWVWVTTSQLVAAMRTKDTIENRGFLLVSDK